MAVMPTEPGRARTWLALVVLASTGAAHAQLYQGVGSQDEPLLSDRPLVAAGTAPHHSAATPVLSASVSMGPRPYRPTHPSAEPDPDTAARETGQQIGKGFLQDD